MDISGFVRAIDGQKLRCEGALVFQHGKKCASHRWIPEAPRNCYSISKSFTSIAAGMAIEQGKLSLSDRVAEAFPDSIGKQVRDPVQERRLAALTLEQLLSMTRGHAAFSRPATVAVALEQELLFDPGSRFVYDNGSSFLVSAMITRAMGMTARDFLRDALFRPLGITECEWGISADGHTLGATGLFLSTTSLALFGQFLLQKGEWQGKQLVSPAWIESAVRPQVSTENSPHPDYNLGYGYGFWPCRHNAFRADGKDGQFVIVLPSKDAVVAVNSDEEKHYPILYAVWDEIFPLL